jgi:hypothetical protein
VKHPVSLSSRGSWPKYSHLIKDTSCSGKNRETYLPQPVLSSNLSPSQSTKRRGAAVPFPRTLHRDSTACERLFTQKAIHTFAYDRVPSLDKSTRVSTDLLYRRPRHLRGLHDISKPRLFSWNQRLSAPSCDRLPRTRYIVLAASRFIRSNSIDK